MHTNIFTKFDEDLTETLTKRAENLWMPPARLPVAGVPIICPFFKQAYKNNLHGFLVSFFQLCLYSERSR